MSKLKLKDFFTWRTKTEINFAAQLLNHSILLKAVEDAQVQSLLSVFSLTVCSSLHLKMVLMLLMTDISQLKDIRTNMKQEVLVISVDGLICAHQLSSHLLILIHGYKGPKQHETYSHY